MYICTRVLDFLELELTGSSELGIEPGTPEEQQVVLSTTDPSLQPGREEHYG